MGATNANLLRGTLELVILKALSWEPLHGYGISEWIESATDGAFLIEEGTLYPALHRLEKQGLIHASWGLSEKNRKAKYYELAEKGRKRLSQDTEVWHKHARAVANALNHHAPAVQ
jgi:PadR family transcriptional regulator PadR